MNRYVILSLLLATAFAKPLEARIGETPEMCAERYSLKQTPLRSTKGFWDMEQCYEKSGIQLSIRFLNSPEGGLRAEYIEYRPVNQSIVNLSEVKINSLLSTISTNWTKLLPLPPLPPLTAATNAVPDPTKTLVRTSKVKIITLEKTSGIEEKRFKKEAAERKALAEEIENRNREITHLKNVVGITTIPGTNFWQTARTYACGNETTLTIFTDAYVKAYDRHVAFEKARQRRSEATPLQGF
jgi:hypothetical protein